VSGSPIAKETAHLARETYSSKARAQAQNVAAVIRDIERAGVTKLSPHSESSRGPAIKTPRGSTSWQAG
jgi:hypothetical protein